MPTTTIQTPLADSRFEHRVVRELCRWWRDRDVDIRHVLTRFETLGGERVYGGPLPLGSGRRAFALVTCVVSQERDGDFKRDLARHLRDVLGPDVPADRVFVSFCPTDPADHFTPGSDAWHDQEEALCP